MKDNVLFYLVTVSLGGSLRMNAFTAYSCLGGVTHLWYLELFWLGYQKKVKGASLAYSKIISQHKVISCEKVT